MAPRPDALTRATTAVAPGYWTDRRMLDAFIIEQLRRERERRQQQEAGVPLELPLPQAPPAEPGEPAEGPDPEPPDRGAIIIEL